MKVFSFKQFLEEEDTKAIVQTGVNSKSLDNNVTKEMLNAQLAKTTGHPFITPYIALGAIARVLAYANIILPQYVFLDRKEGEVVFDATQFGKMAGVNLDGSPANNDTEYFVYFSYSMNDEGYYDCFAVLADQDELDKILDTNDEDVDEVEETQEIEEEQIDEADHHILVRLSKSKEKMYQKPVVVTGVHKDDKNAALEKAEKHFQKQGLTVHALKYLRTREASTHLDGESGVREELKDRITAHKEIKKSKRTRNRSN